MTTLVAVETSDLVGSTKMSRADLSNTIGLIKTQHNKLLGNNDDVEYFRGDAFQVLYQQPLTALKKALLLRLQLAFDLPRPVNISQSIVIGELNEDSVSNKQSLSMKMDKPFIESGRQLDKLVKGDLGISAKFLNDDFMLALAFFNRVLKSLSAKQSEVLYWYIIMDFPEQKIVAEKLNMTRQNVNTHLIRANADLIRRFYSLYQQHVSTHVEGVN